MDNPPHDVPYDCGGSDCNHFRPFCKSGPFVESLDRHARVFVTTIVLVARSLCDGIGSGTYLQ